MSEFPHSSENPISITFDMVAKPSGESLQRLRALVGEQRNKLINPGKISAEKDDDLAVFDHVFLLAQGIQVLKASMSAGFSRDSTVRWAQRKGEDIGVSILGIKDNKVKASFWGVRWQDRRQGIALRLLQADLKYLQTLPDLEQVFTVDVWEASRKLFEHPSIQAMGIQTKPIGTRLNATSLQVTLPNSTL